jgi:enolase-phosphatase E1
MTGQYAIVTDIEGTTSSISFVKDQLFPYARRRLAAFVADNRASAEVQDCLRQSRELAGVAGASDDEVVEMLARWIDEDRKVTPLKTLQGLMWAEGFAAGELSGHVYGDVADALRAWRAAGISLWVFSSGSIKGQKLIYGHTAFGDLNPFFSGYFDTATGPKLTASSYTTIAKAIGLPPGRILFLSDHIGELNAARVAGFGTAALNRGETVLPQGHGHPEFNSFADIDPRGAGLFPLL